MKIDLQTIRAAAAVIATNIRNTEIELFLDVLKKAGLLGAFKKFYEEGQALNIFESMREFAKLHPDKFSSPEKIETYEKFIVIS